MKGDRQEGSSVSDVGAPVGRTLARSPLRLTLPGLQQPMFCSWFIIRLSSGSSTVMYAHAVLPALHSFQHW